MNDVAAPSALARVVGVAKEYRLTSELTVRALRGVDIDFGRGDFVAIMGSSGSGKSTLLNILGCLDRPTRGRYILAGRDVSQLDDNQLSRIRGRYLGFIFQSYNLIQQLNVVENIQAPLQYQGNLNRQTKARCLQLARMVGLGQRLDHRPTQLSGGQQQRVAIARALVNDPHLILADEPTGNLDTATGAEIMDLLKTLNRVGRTIIMVTHEPDLAQHAHRIVYLRDGLVDRVEITAAGAAAQ